jgi:DNA-binding transcriptional ArsR family regulator
MEFLEKNSDKVAKVLKAIASPVRLKILRALSDNSLSVANIQKQVGTSRSNIAQSLIILKKNEIVASYHIRRNQ